MQSILKVHVVKESWKFAVRNRCFVWHRNSFKALCTVRGLFPIGAIVIVVFCFNAAWGMSQVG